MTSLFHSLPKIAKRTAAAATLTFAFTTPAHAQFYWNAPDNRGAPVTGSETDIGFALPGATPAENEASLVLAMQTGLNTGALQCQFEPLLMTVDNYNYALQRHGLEFVDGYKKVEGYFKRTQGKSWQSAFDTYRTQMYNRFGTVTGQLTFCQAAGSIGNAAVQAPVGGIGTLAKLRMREFRNSLATRTDGIRMSYRPQWLPLVLPSLEKKCWNGKNELKGDCRRNYEAALAQSRVFVSS